MKNRWLKTFSLIFLVICLVLAWMNFSGRMSEASFKLWFLVMSVLYFLLATFSFRKKSGA